MKKTIVRLIASAFAAALIFTAAAPVVAMAADDTAAVATESDEVSSTKAKAFAAAICIGVVAAAGAIAMGISIKSSAESVARQPEAEGSIRTLMMLGLVFVETAIIYALIVAILIIFVL